MSKATELLDAAPADVQRCVTHHACNCAAWRLAEWERLVNRLPDYEAAAEALERLVAMFDGNVVGNALVMHHSTCMTEAEGLIDGTISCTCGADEPLANAEAALRRLRDEVPA